LAMASRSSLEHPLSVRTREAARGAPSASAFNTRCFIETPKQTPGEIRPAETAGTLLSASFFSAMHHRQTNHHQHCENKESRKSAFHIHGSTFPRAAASMVSAMLRAADALRRAASRWGACLHAFASFKSSAARLRHADADVAGWPFDFARARGGTCALTPCLSDPPSFSQRAMELAPAGWNGRGVKFGIKVTCPRGACRGGVGCAFPRVVQSRRNATHRNGVA
jgi:hypothetical protein